MNKKTVSSVIAQMLKRMGIDVLFRYIPARICGGIVLKSV